MDALTAIINEWDPTNLMSHAPDDEYELEIGMIREMLDKTDNENDLAEGILNIFLETCGNEFFKKTLEDCIMIANKILRANEKSE
jgi:Domain of unknown function (DUF1871).